MGEDFLAQAALAAIEGFERAYVPFKTRESEDFLARRRKQEEIGLETEAKSRLLRERESSLSESIPVFDEEGNVIGYSRQRPFQMRGQKLTETEEKKPALPSFEDKSEQKEKEIILKNTTSQLPKLKTEAISAKTNIESIDRALGLVEKGVTGKKGQIKAFLAGYSEFSGEEIQGLSDAQTFQLLTRAIVGPMRLEIVGPGPVSEWEQQLMQRISGGGGAAKSAAKELLSRYRNLAKEKIVNYNSTLEGAVNLNKEFKKLYSPVSFDEKIKKELTLPSVGITKKTGGKMMIDAKGNRAVVYPDGTFKEIK